MTPDEAATNLRKAIIDYAEIMGYVKSGEMLDHFAIISQWPDLGSNEENGIYILLFHHEHVPPHIAKGLFSQALHILTDHDSHGEED